MLATTTAEKGQFVQHLGIQHEDKFSAKATWTYRQAFFLPENWARLLKKIKADEKVEEKCVPACVHSARCTARCTVHSAEGSLHMPAGPQRWRTSPSRFLNLILPTCWISLKYGAWKKEFSTSKVLVINSFSPNRGQVKSPTEIYWDQEGRRAVVTSW